MQQTPVFEAYWRFATERQEIFHRRLVDPTGPWTDDPILSNYRFTNAYRASDRVSQYLIGEVQQGRDRSDRPSEVFFRTILFKIFNKIDTWEEVERRYGPIKYEGIDWEKMLLCFDRMHKAGITLYSGAYIMPAPHFGHSRKYTNHISLLKKMMDDRVPDRIVQMPSLEDVYRLILSYPGIGPFLAFQYTIDINYSEMTNFSENDFVVAGPGAIDGISKCFADAKQYSPEQIIQLVTNQQDFWLKHYGLNFKSLFGRKLHLIDCQNLFCEISKYSRVSHPEFSGVTGRTRIKQGYKFDSRRLPNLIFPSKWGLKPIKSLVGTNQTPYLYGRLL